MRRERERERERERKREREREDKGESGPVLREKKLIQEEDLVLVNDVDVHAVFVVVPPPPPDFSSSLSPLLPPLLSPSLSPLSPLSSLSGSQPLTAAMLCLMGIHHQVLVRAPPTTSFIRDGFLRVAFMIDSRKLCLLKRARLSKVYLKQRRRRLHHHASG